MNQELSTQYLLELIKISDQRCRTQNKQYYYSVNGYKVDNVFLATWYEQTHNTFAHFVCPNKISKIKNELQDKNVDLTKNYNAEYLKKVRASNNYLQLFLSGGADSATALKDAVENNIFIDEIVSVISGNSINLPENIEVSKSATKYAEKYKGKYGKYTIHQTDYAWLTKFYKDPYVFLKIAEAGACYPIFRSHFHSLPPAQGPRLFGAAKPQLLHYKNRWYTVCFDSSFSGHFSVDNHCPIGFEPANIKSLISDSIRYRNYLQKNKKINSKPQFFTPARNDPGHICNRSDLEFLPYNLLKAGGMDIWPQKDVYAISAILSNQDLELFIGYSQALKNLVDIFPNFDLKDKQIYHNKFCWAIDIDSLEVYTQQELIPNGFED